MVTIERLAVRVVFRGSRYWAAVSMTSRPLYCPQLGHTRWGTFGSWQFGHSAWAGLRSASWARRFWVRALECRRFGFGISLVSWF
jgi:hypothetical protein